MRREPQERVKPLKRQAQVIWLERKVELVIKHSLRGHLSTFFCLVRGSRIILAVASAKLHLATKMQLRHRSFKVLSMLFGSAKSQLSQLVPLALMAKDSTQTKLQKARAGFLNYQ